MIIHMCTFYLRTLDLGVAGMLFSPIWSFFLSFFPVIYNLQKKKKICTTEKKKKKEKFIFLYEYIHIIYLVTQTLTNAPRLFVQPTDLVSRVFANGLGGQDSIPGQVIPKTQKNGI